VTKTHGTQRPLRSQRENPEFLCVLCELCVQTACRLPRAFTVEAAASGSTRPPSTSCVSARGIGPELAAKPQPAHRAGLAVAKFRPQHQRARWRACALVGEAELVHRQEIPDRVERARGRDQRRLRRQRLRQ
jgi:hypothetical protein